MNIEELKSHYLNIYKDFNKRGFRYKFVLMLTVIPAAFNIFRTRSGGFNSSYRWYQGMSLTSIVLVLLAIIAFWAINIFIMDSMLFISNRKLIAIKNNFKHDLRSIIETEIPEITDYIYYQKIHPNTFFSSGFFKSRDDEYLGDDWMKGYYKDVKFELCELNVYKVFKKKFNGIFVHLTFEDEKADKKLSITDFGVEAKELMSHFMNTYNAIINISNVDYKMYLSFKMDGIFFENKNKKSILKLDTDFNMLKDIVRIIKLVADNR